MFGRWMSSLETTPISVVGWFAAFAGVLWIRYFLEAFSSPSASGYVPSDFPTLVHYTLFYLAAIVMAVVTISIVTRISPLHMMRVLVYILPIIWLAPLIDLVCGGARMGYISAATPALLFHDLVTYFGPFTRTGATLGLRIELGILILMFGTYIYLHTKRLVTTFLGILTGYLVIFFTGALPSILSFFLPMGAGVALQSGLISHNFLHPSEVYSAYRTSELLFDAVMAQSWYLVLCIFGVSWLYLIRKDIVIAMVKNIRPERVGHFLVVAFLGGYIAFIEGSRVDWTVLDVITVTVAVLTTICACMVAIMTNDLVDEPIDIISNTNRPLVTGALTKDVMQDALMVCALMTLLGALSLGSYATFWILVFSAAYYIYSAPPLRLKRVPILASVFIGVATLAIMLMGFFIVSNDQGLAAFPRSIALLVVLFMTLITNVRDLKDIKGDTAAGIWTLPTLFGESRSRMIIGLMMFIAYMLVPFFIPVSILWAPSLIIGAVSWAGLIHGRGEKFVFPLYFLYLISIVSLTHFF